MKDLVRQHLFLHLMMLKYTKGGKRFFPMFFFSFCLAGGSISEVRRALHNECLLDKAL